MNSNVKFDREASAQEAERQAAFIERGKLLVSALSRELGRKPRACTVTFGCQMNAKDSEKIAGILREVGYELTQDEDADFVIYNTCTVRDNVFGIDRDTFDHPLLAILCGTNICVADNTFPEGCVPVATSSLLD